MCLLIIVMIIIKGKLSVKQRQKYKDTRLDLRQEDDSVRENV